MWYIIYIIYIIYSLNLKTIFLFIIITREYLCWYNYLSYSRLFLIFLYCFDFYVNLYFSLYIFYCFISCLNHIFFLSYYVYLVKCISVLFSYTSCWKTYLPHNSDQVQVCPCVCVFLLILSLSWIDCNILRQIKVIRWLEIIK